MTEQSKMYDDATRTVVSQLVSSTNELTTYVISLLDSVSLDINVLIHQLTGATEEIDSGVATLIEIREETLADIYKIQEDISGTYEVFMAESMKLRNDLAGMYTQADELQNRIDTLEKAEKDLRNLYNSLSGIAASLESDINTANIKVRDIQGRITQAEIDLSGLKTQIETLSVSVQQNLITAADFESRMSALETQVNNAVFNLDYVNTQISRAIADVNAVSQQVADAGRMSSDALDLASTAYDRVNSLSIEVDGLTFQVGQVATSYNTLIASVSDANAAVDAVNTRVNTLVASVNDTTVNVTSRLSDMENDLRETSVNLDNATSTLSQLQGNIDTLNIDYQSLNGQVQEQIRDAVLAADAANTSAASLSSDIAALTTLMQQYTDQAEQAGRDIQVLHDQILSTTLEVDARLGEISDKADQALDAASKAGARVFDTVADMMESTSLSAGMLVSTRGYFKPTRHGAASYDIWDLEAYRASIQNPTWVPDGETLIMDGKSFYAGGDHVLKKGLVAILRFSQLWAGQLGLPDPVTNEDDYVARQTHHDFGLQKATEFAKKTISPTRSSTSKNGVGEFSNAILHIEPGVYIITKTIWVPATVLLVGGTTWGTGGRYVKFIPLKPHLGGNINNYIRGYMFIFNGNREWPGTPTIPRGSTPMESIYCSVYVGGMSGISLDNYETGYGETDGKVDYYKPNYLKGINGSMVFGGGIFQSCTGDRIWTFAHRPGVDWLDFYTDGWVVIDYKSNTPLENEAYQFDFNGSGDVIKFDGIQFPVSVETSDPEDQWHKGEYLNGPPKGIRLQNWTSESIKPPGQGGSQEQIAYVGAGMRIDRVINGVIDLYGYRQVTIEACHLEFGQVIIHQGSANVRNCYFSKNTGHEYNVIECRRGQWGGIGTSLNLENCEFHRGFDGAHYPDEEGYYDLVIDENYTVNIKNCFQGWDIAGSNQYVAITVGVFNYDNDTIKPMPGWTRWSPYLSESATFVRGRLVPKSIEVQWNGFEGVQDVVSTRSAKQVNFTKPTDMTYYYYAQYLADPGDETVSPDFMPLGRNQRDRYNLDALGNPTSERFDAHAYVRAPGMYDDGVNAPYMCYYRPVIFFYGEEETPDYGTIRLYRGTAPFQYDEYVELPMMSRASVDDQGDSVFGRKWIPNPITKDTNPDLNLRKRNIIQVKGAAMTKYLLNLRSGTALSMEVGRGINYFGQEDIENIGTGGWERKDTLTITRASNKSVLAAEEGVMNSVCILDQPFDGDVYVNLPTTGTDNWDGSEKIKYVKGTKCDIIRTASTVGPSGIVYAMFLQLEQPDGTKVILRDMLPGEVATAIYDEKDILDTDGVSFKRVGEWIVTSSTGRLVSEHYYFEAAAGEYYQLLPADIYETNAVYNYASSDTIYAGVPENAKIGSLVKISRSIANNGMLYVLVKAEDDSNANVISIGTCNNVTTLLKRATGWVIESQISNIKTNYVVATDAWEFFDATKITSGLMVIDHKYMPPGEEDGGSITMAEDAAVGSEVMIKTALTIGDLTIQTPSGTIATVTKASTTHILKIAEGSGPDKWVVISGGT